MKRGCIILLLTSLFATYSNSLASQPLLTGPVCVVPGIVYQYDANTRWDSTSPARICITGGMLSDFNNSCAEGVGFSSIKIIWADTLSGTITAHFPDGDTSFTVDITSPLKAGYIDVSQTQVIDTLTVPALINCSNPAGGSCSPQYSYSWQHSNDGISWKDIDNANSAALSFNIPLPQSTYFRRKVKDTISGTLGYSNIAAVFIVNNN